MSVVHFFFFLNSGVVETIAKHKFSKQLMDDEAQWLVMPLTLRLVPWKSSISVFIFDSVTACTSKYFVVSFQWDCWVEIPVYKTIEILLQ